MNKTHTATTHSEWAKVIDTSAQEGRLYHFNGGQAYIEEAGALLIVDMTKTPCPTFSYNTGDFASNYFGLYDPKGASDIITESPLTPFYTKWEERNLLLARNEG